MDVGIVVERDEPLHLDVGGVDEQREGDGVVVVPGLLLDPVACVDLLAAGVFPAPSRSSSATVMGSPILYTHSLPRFRK